MAKAPDWTIEPYAGVGPLSFGMSPEQAEAILGPHETRNPAGDTRGRPLKGSFTEFRKGTALPVLTYVSGALVLMDFMKGAKTLSLDGTPLFAGSRQAVIDALIDRSSNVFENFEGYDFLDHGITMLSAENARGSALSGNWNIGIFATGYRDAGIRETLADDLGTFIKGGFVS